MANEDRRRAAGRDRTDEDRPGDRRDGPGDARREQRGSGREGFWGRGHEGSGYERDAHREYSREDYGRGAYGEIERGGGFSRESEEGRGSPAHGQRGDHTQEASGRSDGPRSTRERGLIERATDEVSSRFGDRSAPRR